jgi:hypothetical protein
MEVFLVAGLIQAVIFGAFCSFIAGQKNRSKSNWFFLGFFFSILAVLALIAIPKTELLINKKIYSTLDNSKNYYIKKEELYEGEANIEIPSYQLFLTKRFNIEKNQTLDKFVIEKNVFDTLKDALQYADNKYTIHINSEFDKKLLSVNKTDYFSITEKINKKNAEMLLFTQESIGINKNRKEILTLIFIAVIILLFVILNASMK